MSASDVKLSDLRDAAARVADPSDERPTWVWNRSGSTLLWANEAGLTALGLEDGHQAEVKPSAPAVRSLQAVAGTSASGRGRIEILRISANGHHATLVATCRSVDLGEDIGVLAIGSASQRRAPSPAVVPVPADEEPSADAVPQDLAPVVATDAEFPAEPDTDDAFNLDIAPAETSDPVESSVEPSEGLLAAAAAFAFKPRSRPHRFSFLVDSDGQIRNLSSGLADAVGTERALADGDDAIEALRARAVDVPDSLVHSIEHGRRFKETELLWPVEGQEDLVVPVRLSAFDEDDGDLRIFGTALTGKAVSSDEVAENSGEPSDAPVAPAVDTSDDHQEPDTEDDGDASEANGALETVAVGGAGLAATAALASQLSDGVDDSSEEEPSTEVDDAAEAETVETLAEGSPTEADNDATPSDTEDDDEPSVEMTAQVPGGAALAAAVGAITAGVSAGLARDLSQTSDMEDEGSDETEAEPFDQQTEASEDPEPAVLVVDEQTEEADPETSESELAAAAGELMQDETTSETDGDDESAAEAEPDYPTETLDAMKAVAAGIAAGLTGGALARAASGTSDTDAPSEGAAVDEGAPADVFASSDEETIIPASLQNISADESAVIDDDLSKPEHLTFQEIARRLGARITGKNGDGEEGDDGVGLESADSDEKVSDRQSGDVVQLVTSETENDDQPEEDETPVTADDQTHSVAGGQVLPFSRTEPNAERMVLDRLPLGVIIYTDEEILYANRAALDLAGLSNLQSLQALGGIDALFDQGVEDGIGAMTMIGRDGSTTQITGRLQSVRWDGQSAALLSIREHTPVDSAAQEADQDASLLAAAAPAAGAALLANDASDSADGALPLVRARIGELEAIIDLASDGVITLDGEGEIKDLNQAAQALVGYAADDLIGRPFRLLFPEDSRQTALDYLEDMVSQGRLSLFNEGRELECITAQGGMVPVFMTLGRLTDDEPATYCAVLRDLSPFKQAESDLVDARRAAEEASAHKSDFLARVSHEIRTPLNAVIGFSEVMLEERFGPVGSERYRQYLRDIHTSGEHLMSLLNDLMDLSKIEAGKMDLTFDEVDLNDVVQQCLAITQPQANQGRIIVRTSLPLTLPHVVADLRSIRQIILNLMSNAIKFTDAGGQIIVSTLYEPSGEVSLRVRDTGRGMDPEDLELALQPFRQVPTTLNQVITGTGLGLPLTKALVEANRAEFGLESTPGEGTLAMMTFPSQRVLAE